MRLLKLITYGFTVKGQGGANGSHHLQGGLALKTIKTREGKA